MPRFIYTAKSQPQKTIHGDIEAETEQEAINKLTKMGYFPLSVRAEISSFGRQDIFYLRRVSKKDALFFTRYLSTLIESGVNIINSLNIISNQTSNRYLKAVISEIISKIKSGSSLSEGLSFYPHLFPSLYVAMVRTGEVSGNLKDILKNLSDFLEKEEEFKNSLRSALVYPFFVLAVGVLTVSVLLVFVIPRLITMFIDMGQILPLPTRMLINVSGFLHRYIFLIIMIVFVFIFLLRRFRRSVKGKLLWDKLKLKTALIGRIILKIEISRLMRTLALLLKSGMPITVSLEISESVLDNQVLREEIMKFKGEINSGLNLSRSFKDSKLFPEFVTNIVSIGEETGTLDKSLLRIAGDYETEADRSLKTLARLLEPVIVLIVGLVVGFIVLAMLLPIFQINLIVR